MKLDELEKLNDVEQIIYYYDLEYVLEISLNEFSEWVDEFINGYAGKHSDVERAYIRIGNKGLVYIRFSDVKGLGSDYTDCNNVISAAKQFKFYISFIHAYTVIDEWYYKDYLYFMNQFMDKCCNWPSFEYRFVNPFNGRSFNKFIEAQIAYADEPIYIYDI